MTTFGLDDSCAYSYYSKARLKVVAMKEEETYPRLFRMLRAISPRIVSGIKKHLLNMVLNLTFEIEVVK